MTTSDIANLRLQNQQISLQTFTQPGQLVLWLGAMQAQDYPGAKWAIALRLPEATESRIEQAISNGEIIRTWPMRHTLHFVAPADVRWMLDLLAPRVIQAAAGRRRNLDLDEKTLEKSRQLIIKALEGGKCLTRNEMYQVLEKGGISPAGQRGIHIFSYWCLQKLLCFGPHSVKQPSFVLLDEWIAPTQPLDQDEALAKLAERYFSSHGPAQLADFVWWSGLKTSDARVGIELSSSKLTKITVEDKIYWYTKDAQAPAITTPTAYLLPGFDEFMLGYKDRSAALPTQHNQSINPGANGMFANTIIIDGQVVGTWRRTIKKRQVEIALSPFKPLTKPQKGAISIAADRYGSFLKTLAVIK